MDIDTHLKLKSKVSVIGSVTDFTYKWGLNAGLNDDDATRLTLAVDELVTDVVLFAFKSEEGEFDLSYQWSPSRVEVIVHELGEPFDPERHLYDRERALTEGHFEGAGFELIRHLVDDFIFINKGRAGKEFRLIKNNTAEHIADLLLDQETGRETPASPETTYVVQPVTEADAEDVAKLIYKTYGYTYIKEELYFPKKIELALEREEKFGVLARTMEGEAVGYFAVLRTTDSRIGEVGEAVVAPAHRQRGIMTRMLHGLIDMSKKRNLLGLFGEAVTVHTFSQKANVRFDFQSTALLLGAFPSLKYKGIIEDYPQDLSIIVDFLPLHQTQTVTRYLPSRYKAILTDIYQHLGLTIYDAEASTPVPQARSEVDLKISYEFQHAVIVVRHFGEDLLERIEHTARSLELQGLHAIFIDLPLDDPGTRLYIKDLWAQGFLFCGLMPLFHQERDYLRLQKVSKQLDFDHIHVYAEIAQKIKALIAEEWT